MSDKVLSDASSELGRVWLAAHWDKKLSALHIYTHDIPGTVTALTH